MNRNDYRRALVMLRSLKTGVSGYVRLERRTLMGTLQFTINGAPTGGELYAILLYRKNGGWSAVKVDAFGAPRYGQVGLVWKFDPRNIEGRTLEMYELAAVIEIRSGICDLVLCGNLNGAVEADWTQVREAACRLFSPVRISGAPISPIDEKQPCRTEETENNGIQTLPEFSEEQPAYPGNELQEEGAASEGGDNAAGNPELSGNESSSEEPPTEEAAAGEQNRASQEEHRLSENQANQNDGCQDANSWEEQRKPTSDRTAESSGSASDASDDTAEETKRRCSPCKQQNGEANIAALSNSVHHPNSESAGQLLNPSAEADALDIPAVNSVEADELDTPACEADELDILDVPAGRMEDNSFMAAAKAALSSTAYSSPAAEAAVESDELDMPAQDFPSSQQATAGEQLELTNPGAAWPEAIEPLRSLFFSSEAIVPFASDGYVFIRAPLAEETGVSSCLVGIYCENGEPARVCYAIPAAYTPEAPAGLEGYVWRGDRTRGYWVICESVDSD